jgi:hypothetical protein
VFPLMVVICRSIRLYQSIQKLMKMSTIVIVTDKITSLFINNFNNFLVIGCCRKRKFGIEVERKSFKISCRLKINKTAENKRLDVN